jgi:hypothetical protein
MVADEFLYWGMAEQVEFLPIEGGLELSVLRQEAGRHHEVLDARSCASVAIARVADLAVTAVAKGFSFGKVPDASFTDAIKRTIRTDDGQMCTLGPAGFDPGAMEPSGSCALIEGYWVHGA